MHDDAYLKLTCYYNALQCPPKMGGHTWQCSGIIPGSALRDHYWRSSTDHVGCWVSNPSQPCVKQISPRSIALAQKKHFLKLLENTNQLQIPEACDIFQISKYTFYLLRKWLSNTIHSTKGHTLPTIYTKTALYPMFLRMPECFRIQPSWIQGKRETSLTKQFGDRLWPLFFLGCCLRENRSFLLPWPWDFSTPELPKL